MLSSEVIANCSLRFSLPTLTPKERAMLRNITKGKSWPCKLSRYSGATFAVFVLSTALFQSKQGKAQNATMEQLTAQCQGKGTVRQGPDGLYYCYLTKAGIAQTNAEGWRAGCQALERAGRLTAGGLTPESLKFIREHCLTVSKLHDKKEHPASSAPHKQAEISGLGARENIKKPKPQTAISVPPTPNPAIPTTAPLPPITPATFGVRVALVIGNSSYRNVAALPNPARDAEMIASTLRQVGFQTVTLANNLSHESLIDALHSFARTAENADWAAHLLCRTRS
jgi:hypothetical protein